MRIIDFNRPDGKNLQIEIIKYAIEDSSRNKTLKRHRHNFHSIFFITKGKSVQEIDFEEFELAEKHLMLIPKGAVHWEKEHHNFEGFTILFTDEFFSSHQNRLLYGLLQYAVIHRKLHIPIPSISIGAIQNYFDLLSFEQSSYHNPNQIFILQNLMLSLLNHLEGVILDTVKKQSFLEYRKPFQHFVELIESNYKQQKELNFYFNKLNITPKKLNHIVKEITGRTASQMIIDRVIIEAKRELGFNENSIKEIAFYLGYSDQYYFSRIFKKYTHVTPKIYRNKFA